MLRVRAATCHTDFAARVIWEVGHIVDSALRRTHAPRRRERTRGQCTRASRIIINDPFNANNGLAKHSELVIHNLLIINDTLNIFLITERPNKGATEANFRAYGLLQDQRSGRVKPAG